MPNLGLSILLAYSLDILFGDPYWLPHPVRGMGKLINYLERKLRNISALSCRTSHDFFKQRATSNEQRKPLGASINSYTTRKSISAEMWSGAILAIIVVGLTYLGVFFIIRLAKYINEWVGFATSTIFIYTTLSTRSLGKEAISVYQSLKVGNIKEARRKLSLIVGRDTQTLNQDEIIRATVETVAENSVDGVIAPLLYAALGGAPLALTYKAINTLDSMVGYKNERYIYFGWFSAKLDDVANYIPARISALLIPIASLILKKRALGAWRSILRDGRKSPSPNAGLPEAGFAGAFGIQLGGAISYQGKRYYKSLIGEKLRKKEQEDIPRAIHLMYVLSLVTLILEVAILWYLQNLF